MLHQTIRFCSARDGVRIGYATLGSGPPMVKPPTFLDSLRRDPTLPGVSHLFEGLASRNTLIFSDLRGCGISDRHVESTGFDDWVNDLEAIVDDLGLDRFTLFGVSAGAATAVGYAVRHPERVSHLIMLGPHIRALGRHVSERGREKLRAFLEVVPRFWDADNPIGRALFADIIETAPPEVQFALDESRRATITPEMCLRVMDCLLDLEVTDLLPRVSVPTLVFHSRRDVRSPFKNSELAVSAIPDSRLVALDSLNHVVQEDEPGWRQFLDAVWEFTGVPEQGLASLGEQSTSPLSPREREITILVAAGKTNAEIARALTLSPATIKTHVHNVLSKLEISRRSELAAYALRHGLAE